MTNLTEKVAGVENSSALLPAGAADSRDVLIFANPIAGRGQGKRTAERLANALSAAGYRPHAIFEKQSSAHLPDLVPHAAISIGGDGTLRSVVSRLAFGKDYEAATPHPTSVLRPPAFEQPPPLLVVPTGTANLMGQNLGIKARAPNLEERVVSALKNYRLVPRDAALANGELFLIVAGAGLDGQIIHELDKRRRGPISLLHYALPTAFSLKDWSYPPITVTVDGKPLFGPAPGMAMVGNIREHGIGFSFLDKAVPDDGLLDVLAFPCKTLFEGLELLLHAAAGQLGEAEGVLYATGRSCEITSPTGAPIPIQADGEKAGFTPLSVQLLPFQVPFILP